MENKALLVLLESVLGKSQKTGKGNYAFVCPFHTSNPPGKKNFEVQLTTNEKKENPSHCWGCDAKFKTVKSLFKKLEVPQNKFDELKIIIVPGKIEHYTNELMELPKEFIPLHNLQEISLDKLTQIESKHAFIYLKRRSISKEDILKYNIGFCKEGKYSHRIIIPSYDENGKLNYFIARDYTEQQPKKYKNPSIDLKSIIGLELYINWNAPIILVEGMLDALTIKRNVIPLFGKVIHEKLMQKLVKSSVDRIYIALDPDAIKNSIKHCEELMSYGKEVYLVEIDGKDVSEIGFGRFLNIIEKTQPLTFEKLIKLKLK
jgi:DNA primase